MGMMRSALVTLCALGIALCGPAALAAAPPAPLPAVRSGWRWGSPTPQGERLNGVAFAGSRGYAVGSEGTALRSDDDGRTWTALASGTLSNLFAVRVLGGDTFITGGECTLLESNDAGRHFRELAVPSGSSCRSRLASFSFVDARTGFLAMSSRAVLATSDGGSSFQPRAPLPRGKVQRIAFSSATSGVAVVDSGGTGQILRTDDGARSWTVVARTADPLSDVTFATAGIGYAVGAGGTLLQSADAGATWHRQALAGIGTTPTHNPFSFVQISCADASSCLIVTAPNGSFEGNAIARTDDGGLSAASALPALDLQTRLGAAGLLAVSYASPFRAVAVGEQGTTVLSDDGGASFPEQISRRIVVENATTIRLGRSPAEAYVPTQQAGGEIAVTSDGGRNWRLMRVPTSAPIADVAFPTPQTGYALGAGRLFRTVNAGHSWSVAGATGKDAGLLLAPSPTVVLLTGRAGVRRSTDAGKSFHTVRSRVVVARRAGRPVRLRLSSFDLSVGAQSIPGAVFAFGSVLGQGESIKDNSLLESTDQGAHWTLIPRPDPRQEIFAISFVTPSTGYVSSDNRLFFTRDRGRSWKLIPGVGSETEPIYPPHNLSFSDARHGYVVVTNGSDGYVTTVLRTANGGRTWVPEQLPGPTPDIAAGGAADYAITEGGQILDTTDGGRYGRRSTLSLAIAGRRTHGTRVRLVGRLRPALGGERVIVSYRYGRRFLWRHSYVPVSAGGAFSLTISRPRARSFAVAQWSGDASFAGAGTPAVRIDSR